MAKDIIPSLLGLLFFSVCGWNKTTNEFNVVFFVLILHNQSILTLLFVVVWRESWSSKT